MAHKMVGIVQANPERFASPRWDRLKQRLGLAEGAPAPVAAVSVAETPERQPAAESEPAEAKPATKAELAEEYERLTGEKPNARWTKAELQAELDNLD